MTDEQRQEIMRRQAEGMRAISDDDLARRQAEAASEARNAYSSADYARGQSDMQNFWRQEGQFIPVPIVQKPTLLERFKLWLRGLNHQ